MSESEFTEFKNYVKYGFLYPETVEKGKLRGSMLDFAKKREYEKALDRAMLYQKESVRFKFLLLIADVAGENGDFDKVEEIVKMALGIPDVSLDEKKHWIFVNVLDWLIQGEKKGSSELFHKITSDADIIKELVRRIIKEKKDAIQKYIEQLIYIAKGIENVWEKSEALSSIASELSSGGLLSWCEQIIPSISGSLYKAEAISSYLLALAKDQTQKAINRLDEITVFNVHIECIQKLTNLFKNQKDELKSLIPYAIEDAQNHRQCISRSNSMLSR